MKTMSIFTISFLAIGLIACKKNNVDDWKTIKKLYRIYHSDEISECKLAGEKVFVGNQNAYDGASNIYDKSFNKLAFCGGWGGSDTICGQLKDCEVVYRHADNIWGQPAVDKYNLNNGILR